MKKVRSFSIFELEKQRPGRNKKTRVNYRYISGGKYRRKFDTITNNKALNKLLYQLAKKILRHRTGTQYEDMYWIDAQEAIVVAEETNSLKEKKIIYSEATEKKIQKYRYLITIHSHPDSFPPSIEDINSNYDHEYDLGIVVCHNGKVYMYAADEYINENYYNLVVVEYLKQGYNEEEAQNKALTELQKNFKIRFKEVTAHDGVRK